MIRRLVRQMLTAQVLSALTVSLCLLIDNIMIGRFLGVQAIAAYGLANPILLIIAAIASLLAAGVQVVCSRSLGKGSQEETNTGYSSAIALALGISLALMALVLIFRSPIARLLGADKDPGLFDDTRDYMAGFIIGAPASMGALILVPFLQMGGKSNLLIAAVLGMTVADVGFDLLSVLVLDGGMFGMGLASSLSYYVAVLIGGGYFLSKKCVFRFSLKDIRWYKIRELFLGGVPSVFHMASCVVQIFLVNKLLLVYGGSVAVAAYTVISTIGNASNCISTGVGGVSLTMSGILFNEEDRSGLRELLRLLARYGVLLGSIAAGLLIIFAPACVRLFIPEAGESQALAIWGLRLYGLGMIPCSVNYALKNGYQGIGRVKTTELISVLEGAVLPSLAALALLSLTGLKGVWCFFLAGELLTLLGILAFAALRSRRLRLKADDVLLLPPDFGVAPGDLMEADIRSMEDVIRLSGAAEEFCRSHGHNPRTGHRLALCVEEMASNTVKHGFAPNGRNHLSIRLQCKGDHWILRFRDDCAAFDPVNYVPQGEDAESVGIRLVLGLASDIRYTYSLNLNNLTIKLDDK